jgi:hypothetical protein
MIGAAVDELTRNVESIAHGGATEGTNRAMSILNAAGSITSETSDFNNDLQAEIIAEDLEKIGRLMAHVETLIFAGTEEHTNRKGETATIPMRPDALAKMGNLYLSASAARASRAGIATSISRTHSDITKREKNLNVSLILEDEEARAAMITLTNKMFGTSGQKKAENDGGN